MNQSLLMSVSHKLSPQYTSLSLNSYNVQRGNNGAKRQIKSPLKENLNLRFNLVKSGS